MEDLTGQRLGSCVILRHLRSGGMGDIYLANQPDLGRQVVVKVIRPDLGATFADDSVAVFQREARAIATLEHPHILPIYDFGEVQGLPYLVMQYVPTGSLADLLAGRTTPGFTLPMAPSLAAKIISQAAEALQYAHDRDIMHLDVKPHNMLMRLLGAPSDPKGAPQPHLLMADFGLARVVSLTGPGTPASGTPLYAAPEQFADAPVLASDQYALAGVAFQLLTGSPLFSGSIAELLHQHQSVPPPPATALNPQLPVAVNAIFARALAKAPTQRYPRVEIFAQQLSSALRAAGYTTGALSAVASPVPPRQPMHMPDQTVAPGQWSPSVSDTFADNASTVAMDSPYSAGSAPSPARPPTPWNAAPSPQRVVVPPRRAGGSPNRLLLGIAAALIAASLIIAGIILLPPLFTTTVILKHVSPTSSAICANVPKFKAANASTAAAAAPFADVPFPAGSLSYDGGVTNVNGKTVHLLHACTPSLTTTSAHSFFTTNMPAKGWALSGSFPANGDGKCGDAYCWAKGGHFVGLDTPTNGSNYVVYDLRLVP